MTTKRALRVISLLMFLIAVVFVSIAINHPELGRVIYIGPFRFGYKQWRICYAVYAMVMVGSFAASFLVKNRKNI